MTSIFHSNLSKDLSLILNDADDFNVIIRVGEDQNVKEFYAHSVILRARSPYFKSELDLTEQLGEDVLELLVASDELMLEELLEHVQYYLIERKANWVQQNLVLVLHTVFNVDGFKKLQDYCLEFICLDSQLLVTLKEFQSLDRDILYSLLARDDLQIDEVVIWECLIRWGIEQTPGLGSENGDITKWNDENFEAFKKTLSQFIPLIRFVRMSSTDFFDKITPYKDIVPKHIYEEMMDFYDAGTFPKATNLLPRAGIIQIESNIMKYKQALIIANWIEKKDAKVTRSKNDSLYEFKLLFRGRRDGFDNISFRSRCNGQGRCLVLIKVDSSPKILGAFNPLGFKDNDIGQWYNTQHSFYFSFDNELDTQNMRISRVKTSCAFHEFRSHGLNFGNSFMVEDQILKIHKTNHYETDLNSTGSYQIREMEVLSVIIR
ncbi:8788_t:CDS:2 [Funneliformis geosporum]|uniref:15302_t:CDS:1 n=1 Tax=Funneliformis geosporum TaxID=1117311 RepID=A0A9W4WM75_9GLOM|nr:8788_t:CDS:2 [Funneliformis geosporum]CAI2171880.1 15302_t:CDS:2 [Funneliformis geosporum]